MRVVQCLLSALFLASLLAGCGESYDVKQLSEKAEEKKSMAEHFMVSAAHPAAVDAGLFVLRSGGNAIDAAVAVQMVLTVAEPSESGIGGGAFLLYRDGKSGDFTVYDGRETAPSAATADRFTIFNIPLPLWAAVPTGLSVGVPGTVAMLHLAHTEQGKLPWHELFKPAILHAEKGIPMSEGLQRQIENDLSLWLFRDTRNYFVRLKKMDQPQLRSRELAQTFRSIASEGPGIFYRGELAGQIIAAAQNRWPGSSDLTVEDFRNYCPEKRNAVCGKYRKWTVCGIPAPSSGGITILQILGILEHFPLGSFEPGDPKAIHLIAEASRLAFADRAQYIGDPAFVNVPEHKLIDAGYLAGRAALIHEDRAMEYAAPGVPDKNFPVKNTAYPYEKATTGTSHFSIVDKHGNAVSMTSSIESPFGSRIMTHGFLLNNQLTDFDFRANQNGRRSPNAVEPDKRPRSSMAPVIVLDMEEKIRLIIGSRGGSRIIGYVVKTLIGVLDWRLPLQKAIAMPNMLHRGEVLELEWGTAWANHTETLEAMGHHVRILPLESGVHGIEQVKHFGTSVDHDINNSQDAISKPDFRIKPQAHKKTDRKQFRYVWQGGADPRMGGIAKGD